MKRTDFYMLGFFVFIIVGHNLVNSSELKQPPKRIMTIEPDTLCSDEINVIDPTIELPDTIEVEKRYFRSWCPLVENKPKKWGEKIKRK